MQYYGPLTPKLDLQSTTKKFEQPQPLLAVGMVGDCLKGKFFEDLQKKSKEGDKQAATQIDTLRNPTRLQQKMQALIRTCLQARTECGKPGLLVDAVLVGSGAF